MLLISICCLTLIILELKSLLLASSLAEVRDYGICVLCICVSEESGGCELPKEK